MPQYDPSVYGGIQQGYQYTYQNLAYPQFTNQRSQKNYNNNKWSMQVNRNYEESNDYEEENTCDCEKCDELPPSCRDVCPNCFSTPPVLAPSYVFLPYPYPYPLSTKTTLTPFIQTTETTKASIIENTIKTEATTIEPAVKAATDKTRVTSATVTLSNSLPDENNDVLRDKSPFNVKDKGQYMLTSLRRTKPNWLPKYGIVPISDKFAEKLMLQLRNMKVLHPHKDNIRNIEDIAPL